ncbi:amino acid adenylation domain-containing protein, partial [Bacillus haynesii]|uniref:non-ribosomal peptide synthetase n=1 Tax=Bacillus haynesii TaxID=1925021 RepID=UPI00227DCEC0
QGGHSLKATALVSRIAKAFGVQVPLKEIFAKPTLEELAAVIQELDESPYAAIEPADKQDTYPVSSAQKRMYVLQQLDEDGTGYNMPAVLKLTGSLDRARLDEVFRQLIRRHESLRTSFETGADGEPVQRIHDDVPFTLIELASAEDFVCPFQLQEAPLFRAALVKEAEESHLLLVDMHHIISDGVSVGTLIHEFSELYDNRTLDPLRIQYKDYAVWQKAFKKGEAYKRQEAYWLKQLDGELPVLDLPADNARPAVRRFAGDHVSFSLDADTSAGLYKIARDNGCTLYMVLLAAYSTLLARLSGQEDIIIGSPIAGRPHKDLEPVIGMFVNTMVMRTYPTENKRFTDFLRDVRQTALEAFEHQDYPFEELVDRLDVVRDMSRNPLFDAMLVVQNMEHQELLLNGLHIQPADMSQTVSKFDLTLQVSEGDECIHFRFEYASSLFKQETIERWTSHFMTMLQHIVHAPQTTLQAISMLTANEQQLLMTSFNRITEQHRPNTTVHELFTRQAAKSPSATALITREGALTYQELDEWSNKIARTLQDRGIGPDLAVGIMIPKSTGLIAAILGTWKSGGAYVPIDLSYPDERKRYVLADSGAKLLITDRKAYHQVPEGFKGEVLLIEDVREQDTTPILSAAEPDHLAYIIYTSGTTGEPKGVMVEHRGVAHTLQWRSAFYEFHDNDTALQLSSFSFDAFVTSMFAPLISGAQIVIPAEEEAKDILAIKQYLAHYGITHMNLIPILYRTLLDVLQPEDTQTLQVVALGGEAIDRSLLDRSFSICPGTEIANEYGPTENSITSTAARRLKRQENVTIGRPIDHTHVYILKGNHLQPIGVTGELCITGPGLARGYINLPEQTAQAFVRDPFHPDQRMYRTGDLAKWLPDGTLQYVGRMDEQVKIRGHRIEIKEVEAALSDLAGVKKAAVVDSVTAAGYKELCAYLVVEGGTDCGMLRKALTKKVPAYMVPAFFKTLDQLPITPNGKLDKRALAKIPHKAQIRQTFTAPDTDIEKELAAIWCGVLGVDKIGIDESFFELGGDSIKALQVSARLHQSGKQLAVKDIFSHPTIQELAPYVRSSQQPISQASVEGEVKWSPVQKWYLSQDMKEAHHFNQSVMLHRTNPLDEDALRKTLKALTVQHDALRLICAKDERENLRLYNRPANIREDQLYNLRIINLTGASKDNEHIIKHQVRKLQKAMDLENGPLVQAGLFRSSEGDDLFLSIHHLAVDGISWRIILEDLASGYEQAIRGDDIELPPKTASFQTYTGQLAKYAESRRLLQQADYWRSIEQHETVALPKEQTHIDKSALKKRNTVSFTLAQQETDALLKDVHNTYNTDTQDLLLASAVLAIQQWAPQKALKIALEGHGRQSEAAHHDISRTVGWFTSIYPVLLQLEPNTWDDRHEEYMIRTLKITKDTLRRIPDKGFGYGVLKYMTPPEKAKIKFGKAPDITFNYLGQFEIANRTQTETEELDAFTFSPLGGGEDISGTWKREQSLDISALVAEGKLTVNMTYETNRFQKETIERLSQDCQYYLRKLMNHCLSKTETEKTVSDFDDRELTEEALKNITDLLGFH